MEFVKSKMEKIFLLVKFINFFLFLFIKSVRILYVITSFKILLHLQFFQRYLILL